MLSTTVTLVGICLVFGAGPDDAKPQAGKGDAKHHVDSAITAPSRGADRQTKDLLDRAIAAYGGDAASKKLKKCRVTYRNVASIPGMKDERGENTVIMEDCYSFPDKLRRTVRRASDNKLILLSVVNGKTMWGNSGDRIQNY